MVVSNRNGIISHNDIVRTVRKLFGRPVLRELRERDVVLLLAVLLIFGFILVEKSLSLTLQYFEMRNRPTFTRLLRL